MVSKLSMELLKFYNCINEKNVIKSKLSYNTIVSRLQGSNELFELEDFEQILGLEVTVDDDIKINDNLINYICDFFKFVSINDYDKAKNCIKCIYNLLDDETTIINMNELVTRLKSDLYKLELKENIKDNIDRAFYYGISIMDVTSDQQLQIYTQVIDEIPNVKMIIIENGEKVAIINKNDKKEKINTFELYNEASRLYYEKKYEESKKVYLDLFRNSKTKVAVCGKLGLCYMMLKQYDVAIDYLTLANNMNVNRLPKYDYTNLIYELENQEISEDEKVKFKMLEEEFYDDVNDYYGIDNINTIISSVNSGFTIEDACNFMNFTEEQTDLVYLIYARDCYYNSDYRNGDKFFKIVQKKKNISGYVKNILNTIRINKYYYKNRKKTDAQIKILKLNNK